MTRIIKNPTLAFSLVCVAATSIYLGIIDNRLINIISSPGWCGKAIQAERITPGNSFQGLTGCIDILKMQIAALAKVLLIGTGTFALCLGVLVIIVIAGARFSGKLGPGGADVDVSREPPVPVTVTNTPAAPVPVAPADPPTGPAMPEPGAPQ